MGRPLVKSLSPHHTSQAGRWAVSRVLVSIRGCVLDPTCHPVCTSIAAPGNMWVNPEEVLLASVLQITERANPFFILQPRKGHTGAEGGRSGRPVV